MSICRYMWVYIDALYMGVCVYICGFVHMNDFFLSCKEEAYKRPCEGACWPLYSVLLFFILKATL